MYLRILKTVMPVITVAALHHKWNVKINSALSGDKKAGHKKDVKNIGGYDNYLLSLINRDVKDESSDASFTVEVELKDLLIPSIAYSGF